MRKSWMWLIFAPILLLVISTMQSAHAETWYPGQGLEQGDFFRYGVCNSLMGCKTPLEFDFWVQNQTTDGNWNLQFIAIDGNSSQRGTVTIGSINPIPISSSPNLAQYADVYKNTIGWINYFSNKTQPKDFANPEWGKWGPQGIDTSHFGGEPLGPTEKKQVTVKARTFEAWVIIWHGGAGEIWISPILPFPVKGTLINPYLGMWGPRIVFDYELLETGNSKTEPMWDKIETSPLENSKNITTNSASNNTQFNIISSKLIPDSYEKSSPLKQFESGIALQNIKCKTDYELIINEKNGKPYCVKPTTVVRLLSHGWITLEKFESEYQITDRTNTISNRTFTNPMNVTDVVKNLDYLYGKHITVSGYWYDMYYSLAPDLQCRTIDPNIKSTYDNSTYAVASYGGNNYLFTAKSYTGEALLVSLPNNKWLFEDPVKHRGEFVMVSGILEKNYSRCGNDHYYKSAILQVNPDQNITTSYDNNTRYPTESVQVHTSGPVGTTNVRNLPPIPNCTYSNYFCSMPANSVTPLPPIHVTSTISSNSNITKIIAIGMSPNSLKVSDIPKFTVTYQNISGKPIYGQQGCGSDLTYIISPDVNVKKILVGRQCAIFEDVIQPNQIVTDGLVSYYKIIQQGLLNVTLTLNLSDNGTNWSNSMNTIQFDVNATQ